MITPEIEQAFRRAFDVAETESLAGDALAALREVAPMIAPAGGGGLDVEQLARFLALQLGPDRQLAYIDRDAQYILKGKWFS